MDILVLIFNFLVFPGLIFSSCVGLLAGWVDRKVSARIQWRVGPPWYQNFADLIKLTEKEIIIPQASKPTFMVSPFIGLIASTLAAAIIGNALILRNDNFGADLIVIIYVLLIPALSLVIGAFASGNPLSSIGASREIKLVLAYELPFILSIITVILKSNGAFSLGSIIGHQAETVSCIKSFSGALAFITAVFCVQAKLGLIPFDAAEAEQEIMSGALIEYSGLLLALFKLIKAILLYVFILLLISLFWAQGLNALALIVKFVVLLTVLILVKNTNPRLRIDQALGFFWGPLALVGFISVLLALAGL